MKKIVFIIALTIYIISNGINAYSQDKKVAKAKDNVKEAEQALRDAKRELAEAKKDSITRLKESRYNDQDRREAELKIYRNKIRITEINAKKNKKIKDEREKYDNKVLALEQQNDDLQKQINGTAYVKRSIWTVFKRNFNNSVDDYAKSSNELGNISIDR